MTRTAAATSRLLGRAAIGLLMVAALATAALFLVPKALGYDTYVITTGSMRGTVDPGGLVISQRVPAAQLVVGDVITYQPPASTGVGHLVTHRITSIGADRLGQTTYRTKGDANPVVDPWTFTLTSGVQPVMRWHVAAMGRPVLWLATPGHRKLALGIPAGMVALIALLEVVQVLRRDEDGDDQGEAVAATAPDLIDLTEPTRAPAAVPAPRTPDHDSALTSA